MKMRALELAYPFSGRWLVQNSPANRVPSHGTDAFASAYAIDFVPLGSGRSTAPMRLRSWLRPEPATVFPGFGRDIFAPVDGEVVAVTDSLPDHEAYRGLPSVGYVLGQRERARRGWEALAGNRILIHVSTGSVVALCHLRQSSVRVTVGDRVRVGQRIAECGNSGNSTEPHLHMQAIDQADIAGASAVPIEFPGGVPRNGNVIEL